MSFKFCRNCRQYKEFDEYFGYCWRYECQAKHNDSCKTIIPTAVKK